MHVTFVVDIAFKAALERLPGFTMNFMQEEYFSQSIFLRGFGVAWEVLGTFT